MWEGTVCFIVGGGPSLENFDYTPLHGKRVIGVNDVFRLGDWVDICFFGDQPWYDRNKNVLAEFGGLKVTNANKCFDQQNRPFPGIRSMRRVGTGVTSHARDLCWNFSSGATAIDLAFHLGCHTAVLLGMDCKFEVKKHEDGREEGIFNWHDYHPGKPRNLEKAKDTYHKFVVGFNQAAQALKKRGWPMQVLNAGPDSALECFPKITLEEAWRL